MSTHTPKTEWIVTGNEVIAWINDLEFFDITYSADTATFALRINHLATATTIYLGESDSVSEAVRSAALWVVRSAEIGEQQNLSCEHGHLLGENCPECTTP